MVCESRTYEDSRAQNEILRVGEKYSELEAGVELRNRKH